MIIKKFPITTEPFTLELPDVFRVVNVAVEGNYSPRVWMLFDNEAKKSTRRFESFRDAVEIDSSYSYVASYTIGLITYHLFMVRT